MDAHRIVSRGEWLAQGVKLLTQEKEFTRQRDRLAAARRALPWVRIEKQYVFDCDKISWDVDDLTCPDLIHRKEICNG